MKNIRKTLRIVEKALQEMPETRASDDLLYVAVCREINPFSVGYSFADVLTNRKAWDIPPFESVRRSRQRLQAEHPEYRPSDDVVIERALLETDIRAFAHEHGTN